MTNKDRKDLIELLLEDKMKLELAISVSKAKMKCKREHLLTIEYVLGVLEN